jgi:hypothetical protein
VYFKTVNDDVKQNAIKAIQGLEGVYDITITKYKKDRTASQNKLMWMWLGIISNDTGESPENLHNIFKLRFLGTEKIQSMGYSIEIPKSTTKLTTQEFTDYLDKIEGLALSIDIRLPHPDELYRESMGL